MLSITLSISFFGISSWMDRSTSLHSAAVSSMRVAVGARRCSLICPASTAGKKVLAEPRVQREGSDADGQEAQRKDHAMGQADSQDPSVEISELFELQFKVSLQTHQGVPACQRPFRRFFLMGFEQDTGPWSARACARASRKPAWRRPRPLPAARTNTAPLP